MANLSNLNIPLFELPENARLHIIKNMGFSELFMLSICSKNSAKIVKNLNIKAKCIDIVIDLVIKMEIFVANGPSFQISFFIMNEEDDEEEENVDARKFEWLVIKSFRANVSMELNFSSKDDTFFWFNHFMSFFNCTNPTSLHLRTMSFDATSVNEVIGNYKFLSIVRAGEVSDEYLLKILKKFPTVESFESDEPSEAAILICNFENIDLSCKMELDDLLLTNSKQISFTGIDLKHFNRFLKHWQKGSNPRLEHLKFYFSLRNGEKLEESSILNGIKFTVNDSNVVRTIDIVAEEVGKKTIQGGIDIFREDGTRGTLVIEYEKFYQLNFYVGL